MDDAAGGTANGNVIQQWACATGSTNQQWEFIPTSGGYYEVIFKGAAQAAFGILQIKPSTANGALLHLWAYGGGANQQWMPVALDSTHYKFVNLYSGTCLDVPAASTTDGIQLEQYACSRDGCAVVEPQRRRRLVANLHTSSTHSDLCSTHSDLHERWRHYFEHNLVYGSQSE